MNIRFEFGQRLKFLRKGKKISQDTLSSLAKIDRGYISEIEHGKSSPTVDLIDKIARALDLYPEEFFIFNLSEPTKNYLGKSITHKE